MHKSCTASRGLQDRTNNLGHLLIVLLNSQYSFDRKHIKTDVLDKI